MKVEIVKKNGTTITIWTNDDRNNGKLQNSILLLVNKGGFVSFGDDFFNRTVIINTDVISEIEFIE